MGRPKKKTFLITLNLKTMSYGLLGGLIIETLRYTKCEVTGYWVYTSYNKDEYPFGKKDESEIRDVSNFLCRGFSLAIP
ncbi:MAG: hypothetical protein WEC35_03270 [Nitrosopumilaceae archaeon]